MRKSTFPAQAAERDCSEIEMTHNRPPVNNTSLRNRLVALTSQQLSVRSIGAASAKLFKRAMRALALPVARRFVLPGEPNPHVEAAFSKVANMPKGVKGLRRKDGSLIVAGYGRNPLAGPISEGEDLTDIYLARLNMYRMKLDGAKMPGADMRLSCLRSTSMNKTDLTGADLRRVSFTEATGEGTQLAGADLTEARATEARLSKANLRGVNFTRTHLHGCRFNECDLRDCDFTTTQFEILYKELSLYEYHSTTLVNKVQMKGADLRGARFSAHTDFDRLDLTGANLDGVIICDKQGEPIEGAVLKQDGTILYAPRIETIKTSSAPTLPGPGH